MESSASSSKFPSAIEKKEHSNITAAAFVRPGAFWWATVGWTWQTVASIILFEGIPGRPNPYKKNKSKSLSDSKNDFETSWGSSSSNSRPLKEWKVSRNQKSLPNSLNYKINSTRSPISGNQYKHNGICVRLSPCLGHFWHFVPEPFLRAKRSFSAGKHKSLRTVYYLENEHSTEKTMVLIGKSSTNDG